MSMRSYTGLLLGIVSLTACGKPAASPIESATNCIRRIVPEGKNVSIGKAQEALERCQSQLDRWSRYSVESSTDEPFQASDRKMMTAFHKHQAASRDYWLKALSRDYAINHSNYH